MKRTIVLDPVGVVGLQRSLGDNCLSNQEVRDGWKHCSYNSWSPPMGSSTDVDSSLLHSSVVKKQQP